VKDAIIRNAQGQDLSLGNDQGTAGTRASTTELGLSEVWTHDMCKSDQQAQPDIFRSHGAFSLAFIDALL
jgi:hypothetical protein